MQGVTPKHGALRSFMGILRWGFLNNLDCVEMREEVDTTSKINLNPDDRLHAPTLYGREWVSKQRWDSHAEKLIPWARW